MIGQIIAALANELKALIANQNGTVILGIEKTKPVYQMPLLVLDIGDAQDYSQTVGGSTKMELDFKIECYNWNPNAELSNDGNFSINLINIIDIVRTHFAKKNWKTKQFIEVCVKYNFSMVFTSLSKAEQLNHEGRHGEIHLVNGKAINFKTIAFDTDTSNITESFLAVEYVELI